MAVNFDKPVAKPQGNQSEAVAGPQTAEVSKVEIKTSKAGNEYLSVWLKLDKGGMIFDSFFDSEKGNAMATGWTEIDGSNYYFDEKGVMLTGWLKTSSTWYYFLSNGKEATGWQKIDGKWYYFGTSYSNAANRDAYVKIDGTYYYFDENGVMYTGWLEHDGSWNYYLSNGKQATGWQQINSKWYYFDPKDEEFKKFKSQ